MNSTKNRGYQQTELTFNEREQRKQKRNRSQSIIWSSPPFSRNVTTNVTKRFVNLLDLHFPKSNKLPTETMSKLVTAASNIYRVLLKLTTCRYAHMLTYAHNILHAHNKEVTNDKITPKGQGDCRNINDYPLDGNSQTIHTYIVLTTVNPDKGNS